MPIRRLLAAPLIAVFVAAAPQPAPDALQAPVPHRAVYSIRLAESTPASGVTGASGRMVFEITGNACEGFTMSQRLVVRLGGGESGDRTLDFRVSTFEAGDGGLYRFATKTYLNDRIIEDVAGVAERTPRGIEVKIQNPGEKTLKLAPRILFPSQHLNALISAARAEQRFLSHEIYEGAGGGETADTATAIIGAPERGVSEEPLTSGMTRWPVSIAYFDAREKSAESLGEETPTYQMSFDLYENGVTRNLVMDYGNYALTGTLESIEPLERSDCKAPG